MRLSRTCAVLRPLGPLAATFMVSLLTRPAAAQERRTLGSGDPETQVLGYHAAVLQFHAAGLPDRDGRLAISAAAGYVPSLSDEDQIVTFGGTQSMNANLCGSVPRFGASKAFGRVSVELAATPSDVCGLESLLFSAALGYRAPLSAQWDGMVRVSGYSGSIEADISCSEEAILNSFNQTCYGGSASQDKLEPFAVAGTLIAAYRGWAARGLESYFMAGVRYERVDYDVNFTRTPAQATAVQLPPLTLNDQYRATFSRVHLGAGTSWTTGRLRLGGNLVYAPGAAVTAAGSVAVLIGRSR